MKILITCPPMLGMIENFRPIFEARGISLTCPATAQVLSVQQLLPLVAEHDGWIVGDDPANRQVLAAGASGRLKAIVKWGVGVDNVDFDACKDLGLAVTNTPGVFGAEVADVALGYLIGLARETFTIDRGVRAGLWPKPRGISLSGKTVALIGYGDIGRSLSPRLAACGLKVIIYDPGILDAPAAEVAVWPERIHEADFVVVTCALTETSRHLLDERAIARLRNGVRIVNVSRGAVISEQALVAALESGHVHSAALDVFETEPLPADSGLRVHPRCIFGAHNGSNTTDAVTRASLLATRHLLQFLGVDNDF